MTWCGRGRSLPWPVLGFAALATVVGCAAAGAAKAQAAPLPFTEAQAVRLLEQSTFGPNEALVAHVLNLGAAAWVDEQLAAAPTTYTSFPPWPATRPATCVDDKTTIPVTATSYCARDNYTLFQLQREFYRNAVMAPDQLRQRVAFALSQILVVSGVKVGQAYAMQRYQQILADHAFGNFRDLLSQITLSPAMGRYLDMANNLKHNARPGVQPNENYARELLQLFSIGMVELDADGSPLLDAAGAPIPTYTQQDIEDLAHVFTGWTYPVAPGAAAAALNPQYYDGVMEQRTQYHEFGAKDVLDTILPANATMSGDLARAIDLIFNHPNAGPFLSRQLIQKLVTGNPSPAYVRRVTAAFNDNGSGVRGDLGAVVRAILLDPDARGAAASDPHYGRLKEPVQFVIATARALNATTDGVFFMGQARALGQPVFESPTVFNFYPPDYVLPGTDLLGPEFALHNMATAFARINYANTLSAATTIKPDASVYGATGTTLDWGALSAVAGSASALVGKLNRLLLHGTLSLQAQDAIVTAVNAIPATDPLARARCAFYLVVSSPQYQVQR